MKLDEFPKTTGVVVVNSLCVTKCFHDRTAKRTKKSVFSKCLFVCSTTTTCCRGPSLHDNVSAKEILFNRPLLIKQVELGVSSLEKFKCHAILIFCIQSPE